MPVHLLLFCRTCPGQLPSLPFSVVLASYRASARYLQRLEHVEECHDYDVRTTCIRTSF